MKYIFLIILIFIMSNCSNDYNNYSSDIQYDTLYNKVDKSNEKYEYNSKDGGVAIEPEKPKEYTIGDITYVMNDTMIIGKINIVNMTISHKIKISDVISDVKTFTPTNTKTKKIRIAPTMRARLIDPTGYNFIITPITNEEQFIEDSDYTIWEWDIKQKKKGNHEIRLSVDIIINNNSKSIKVFDDMIYVYSDDTIIEKIIIFILDNWKWLITTLIIPIFIFFYRKKIRK